MKYGIILFWSVILLIVSCSQEKSKKPFDNQKISYILRDLLLTEAMMAGKTGEEADSIQALYLNTLLNEHNIDTNDLIDLESYLQAHPDSSMELHQKARNELEKLQESVN